MRYEILPALVTIRGREIDILVRNNLSIPLTKSEEDFVAGVIDAARADLRFFDIRSSD